MNPVFSLVERDGRRALLPHAERSRAKILHAVLDNHASPKSHL